MSDALISDAPAGMIAEAQAAGRTLLSEVESKALLAAAGIPVTVARLATSADEAASIASQVGFPVVLKVASSDLAHKSDAGGVLVGIADAEAARAGYERILADVAQAAPDANMDGVSVQRQADPGTEVIVGMTSDPQFGPVVMFGLGGIFVEVLKDVAFRLVPLEPRDAAQMLREIRGLPVLTGTRGQAGADLDALETLLLAVSAFVEAHPEVAELDLNPVFAYPAGHPDGGALAVDARVVLREAVPA
jgi:acyl-CoA synthetase (NDP forming)